MTDTAPFETVYVRRKHYGRALIDGKRRTEFPEYAIWNGIINRCTNPANGNFADYGGRGITVCDRWRQDFANFYADMGSRPSRKHSVDRIDNDKGYSPDNCRWATPVEQARNKRPGGRADAWTPAEIAIITKMWNEYRTVEEIAGVVGRTPGTTRLRLHYLGLRRDSSYTKLSIKHPDIAPILRQIGPDAFLTALKDKIASEKAEKARQKRISEASESEVVRRIMAGQGDRNSKMKALRLAGCDLAEIGRLFGITRERVRQLQLLDFRPAGDAVRKVNSTQPQNRARHVDRLIMAWNKASVEARLAFLEQANADPRSAMPRLIKKPSPFKRAA